MNWIFILVLVSFVFVDVVYIGNIYVVFKVWPSIKSIGNRYKVLEESIFWAKVYSDDVFFKKYINDCMMYRSVVLTDKCIYFKNTSKTYLYKVDLECVEFFRVKKNLFKNSIYFSTKNTPDFEVCPYSLGKWVDGLKSLNIIYFDE